MTSQPTLFVLYVYSVIASRSSGIRIYSAVRMIASALVLKMYNTKVIILPFAFPYILYTVYTLIYSMVQYAPTLTVYTVHIYRYLHSSTISWKEFCRKSCRNSEYYRHILYEMTEAFSPFRIVFVPPISKFPNGGGPTELTTK